jgi:hypothetical protein
MNEELWKWRSGGKRGNPKAGFPLFPPLLGNLAKDARFPHSHSSDDDYGIRREGKEEESGYVGRGKGGNPKAGFPLSHRPDSLRQQGRKTIT